MLRETRILPLWFRRRCRDASDERANGQQRVNLATRIVLPIIARFLCAAAMVRHRSLSAACDETKMFFLIRCVFWLWVVFSTIFAQPSSEHATYASPHARPAAAASQPIGSGAQAWLERAATSVADRCATAPATCLAMAAQLSRLAASNIPVAKPSSAEVTLAAPDIPHRVDVPLPPRRPRSFARMARPTLEKTARHEYLMDQLRAEF